MNKLLLSTTLLMGGILAGPASAQYTGELGRHAQRQATVEVEAEVDVGDSQPTEPRERSQQRHDGIDGRVEHAGRERSDWRDRRDGHESRDRSDWRDRSGDHAGRDGRNDADRYSHDGRRDGSWSDRDRHRDDRWGDHHRRDDRWGDHHRRDDRRYWAQHRYHAPYRYHRPRGYYDYSWDIGYRLPTPFYGRDYYVDYRHYGLSYPPRGYQWVRIDGDVYLVAIGSGLIRDILYGLFY